MASKLKKTIVKKSGSKKGKPKKNMVWSEEEATKYAEVLTDCDNKDRSWLYQLENCALKKQANEKLFGEIKLELEDALQEVSEEKFTVDRLRAKYKWFKKEWRRIDNKIKCGTGLGRDDTKEPKWFKILSPHFCDAVDQMTCVSSKASDLSDEEDAFLNESDGSSSVEESWSSSSKKKALLSTESTSGEEEGNKQENLSSMDDKDTKTFDKDSKEGIKGQLLKKTKVKKHPKRQLKPRSQTDAMLQVAKSIESSAKQQEEMKDQRLETLLKSERQRDEMFLEYQKQQAEANRKHELMMAHILMQASSNTRPPHNSYTPPQPMPFPLQPSGSLGGFQWNNSYNGDAGSENQDGPIYHKL